MDVKWSYPLGVLNGIQAVVAANDHVADDSVHDVQHAIELCDCSRLGFEIDEGVVTVRETVDLVGELALAPLLNVADLATLRSDSRIDTLLSSETGLLVNGRIDEKQQFVSLQLVTSSGLNGSGI